MRADERRGRAYGEFTLSELVGGYLSPCPRPTFFAHNRREVRCRLPSTSGGEDSHCGQRKPLWQRPRAADMGDVGGRLTGLGRCSDSDTDVDHAGALAEWI